MYRTYIHASLSCTHEYSIIHNGSHVYSYTRAGKPVHMQVGVKLHLSNSVALKEGKVVVQNKNGIRKDDPLLVKVHM